MHVLVTGGAGFIGSNLCRALLDRNDKVTVIDNFCTGKMANLEGLPVTIIKADLCEVDNLDGHFDAVFNLACPASPPAYQNIPLETLKVGSIGTNNALSIAMKCNARFIQSSTSEVYGEPQMHPQNEEYRGNVSTTGPRAMYDEAKRFSEALISVYRRTYNVNTGIVRIFNTYGPRMQPDDGRVVTNFLRQINQGRPLTVYGDGQQTRSFCFVSDLVRGLMLMLDSKEPGPVNLGNPAEITMLELAETVEKVTGRNSEIVFEPLPGDDPTRRCPDISKAKLTLGWEPKVNLTEGLTKTWEWIKEH